MQPFTFTQADGSSRTVRGYKYAAPSASAKRYVARSSQISKLPAKVDLRPFMTAVEDQEQTNSCAANAAAGAHEYLLKRHLGEEAWDVSRLYIYYNARAADDPDDIQDEGSVLERVIESMKEHGACSEDTWPFDAENVNAQPPDEAYQEGAQFLFEETELVPTDLEAWKTAIAAGHPIIFGIKLFGSFDKQKKPGLVPAPTRSDANRESHGGHAMLAVGYSDPDEVFIVRNSWGPEWGDEGYCYIPYRYMMNEEYNFGDSWIIKRVEVVEPDESTWSDDEESVLEDVAGVLGAMSDEEYEAMLERMGAYPFQVRLALLFLRAAAAEGDLENAELDQIADYLTPVLEQLGATQSPAKVMQNAMRHLGNEELLEDTVEAFGQGFPPEVLASIAQQLQDVVAADDEIAPEEQAFVDAVIERWQVEPGVAAEEEEGEGDEEEGDEEETE